MTEVSINAAREKYRPIAERGALLFFLMTSLRKVHDFYQFSLGCFVDVFARSIDLGTLCVDWHPLLTGIRCCLMFACITCLVRWRGHRPRFQSAWAAAGGTRDAVLEGQRRSQDGTRVGTRGSEKQRSRVRTCVHEQSVFPWRLLLVLYVGRTVHMSYVVCM